MTSLKKLLIVIICLAGVKNVIAQKITEIPFTTTDKGIMISSTTLDDNVENLDIYKNIPSKYVDFNFKYFYIDPVQGVYEKLMMDTKQPERWQRFKSRFSIPDSIKVYPKQLLNNKLAVFYALDSNQNEVVIIDKNGNKDLADDEVFVIGKNEIPDKKIKLDIPVKIYDRRINILKDSIISLEMFTKTNPGQINSSKDLNIYFANRTNFTAEIKAGGLRYVFSWIPPVTQNRNFISSVLPIRLNTIDKNNNVLNSDLHMTGDTITIDNYKTIIRQYNNKHLIFESGLKQSDGYAVGQTFRQTSGISIFNPSQKVEISAGNYLVIDFWGTWCAPCIAAMPELVAFKNKYQGKVECISIVCDEKSKITLAKKIINEKKLTWPQVWDDKSNSILTKSMHIQFFPTMLVVNKEKKIVYITTDVKDLNRFMENSE